MISKLNSNRIRNSKWILIASCLFASLLIGNQIERFPIWSLVSALLLISILIFGILTKISIPVMLLALSLISEMFLGDIDLGPFSLRVYTIVFLLFLVAAQLGKSRQRLFRSKEAHQLVLIYSIFTLWIFINRFQNGEPLNNIIENIASTNMVAIAVFIVTQYLLRDYREISVLVSSMSMATAASALVGIFQWLGIEWFWNLALTIHPGENAANIILGTQFGSSSRFVPGLALFSILFSYQLITFGMFFVSWTIFQFQQRSVLKRRIVGVIGLTLILVALVISQSRSAVLAGIISLLFLFWILNRVKIHGVEMNRGFLRLIFVMLVMASILLTGFLIYSNIDGQLTLERIGGYKLDRLFYVSDIRSVRGTLAEAAIDFLSNNLLFGGGGTKFFEWLETTQTVSYQVVPQSPHNMFLNALVYYGLPGLILLLILLRFVFWTFKRTWQLIGNSIVMDWIIIGTLMGLAAYLVNAMFHNDSFVTGSTLPWWLLGIMCALLSIEQQDVE